MACGVDDERRGDDISGRALDAPVADARRSGRHSQGFVYASARMAVTGAKPATGGRPSEWCASCARRVTSRPTSASA